MESVNLDGLILMKDSGECKSDFLSVSLALRASSALLITPNERTLRNRLPKIFDANRITVVNFTEEMSPTALLSELSSKKSAFILIDWLELFIWEWGLDQVANFLYRLKASSCVCTVAQSSVIDSVSFSRLASVADSLFELRRENGVTISHITLYKKNGKLTELEEEFNISENYRLSCTRYNKVHGQVEALQGKDNDPLLNLKASFDIGLNLKESEKRARENLQLPYLKMQNEEGLVDIQMTRDKKIRVGGQIIYTPDEGDDLDDSDPDDDLNL